MGLIAMLGRSASKKERTQHERSSFRSPSLSPHSGGQGHSRSPSNPNSFSAPSPNLTHPAPFVEDSHARPSPTLSPSVHFKTTTDLRGRNLGDGDGISSLQAVQQRGHATLGVPASAATAFTAGPSMVNAPIGKGDGSDPSSTVAHVNLLDDNTDPTPFAALVHPKALKDLDTMGGLEGLCAKAHSLGQGAGDGEKYCGEGAVAAPFSDRRRVYGTNSLPTTRPSKSLALQDKVLVCKYHSPNHLHLALLILP